MKVTKHQLRRIIREVAMEQLLLTAEDAYEEGYTAGFNDFPIEPEMMEANGGHDHPFYRDYMDGFDAGIDDKIGVRY